MATSATSKPAVSSTGFRALPLLVVFDQDPIANLLVGMNRFRRIPFSALADAPQQVEQIFIVSSEDQIAKHYEICRRPNVRIIALTHQRFRDSRADGAIYAYLPPNIAQDILERQIDNALDHV